MRAPLLLIVLIAAVLGGCGGSSPEARPAPTPSEPPNLLTSDYIRREVDRSSISAPADQVLQFWRDTQYQNYPKAYERLSGELRRRVGYEKFVKAFNQAVPVFQFRPRVQSVEVDGDQATVYLLVQDGLKPSPRDAPLAFNLRLGRAGWLISTDPHNVLGLPPQS